MDYYTALKRQGLEKYIPPAYKQGRYPYTQSFAAHRSTALQQSIREDWERYCKTVPPEFRGNHFQEAQKPMSPMQLKAIHDYAQQAFNNLEAQLREYHRRNSW